MPTKPEWTEAMFFAPPRLPPSTWAGHYPFMFLLFSLARPRSFVELGVFFGGSFLAGCEAAKRFNTGTRCFGVDHWRGDDHSGQFDGEAAFSRLSSYLAIRHPTSELIRSSFDAALPSFENGSIDLLHIDGLHTYEAASHDFHAWLPKLSDRAIVLLHDTQERELDFGVWKLWQEISPRYPSFEFHHSCGLGVLLAGSDVPPAVAEFLSVDPSEVRATCNRAAGRLQRSMTFRHLVLDRNEPCPCESGLRYRHCHGSRLPARSHQPPAPVDPAISRNVKAR